MTINDNADSVRGYSCFISLMMTFDAMFNLCPSLSFLWICFLKLKISLHHAGALWIFLTCCIDIIQFFIIIDFTLRYFKNNITRKVLTLCSTISMYVLFACQIAMRIIGSAKFHRWSSFSSAFHATYLVYMILSWCFLFGMITVLFICMVVNCCRRRRAEKIYTMLDEVESKNCCCCCHTHGKKECCSRCGHCCLGMEVDPTRQRVNNSCCCNGCCSCCIDCCIDCCGDKNVPLPEGTTANDIVFASPRHRVIYQPDPNAPITIANQAESLDEFRNLTGVGADRQYLPAVFNSDMASSEGQKTPIYIVPSDIPNSQTLFSTTMTPVLPANSSSTDSHYIIIDGVKYIIQNKS